MSLRTVLQRLLRERGYDLVRFKSTEHPLARRAHILQAKRVDTVLDIGANVGQYARELRDVAGYRGRVVSFEPLGAAFAELAARAETDPLWDVLNVALGDVDEVRDLHVARNSASSSLLEMLPRQTEILPGTRIVADEQVKVVTLDSLFDELCEQARSVYLKIDAQGYERRILAGAQASLPRVGLIQMELSLVPLYEGETLFLDMCALMRDSGFELVVVEPGYSDPASGYVLQVDAVFERG